MRALHSLAVVLVAGLVCTLPDVGAGARLHAGDRIAVEDQEPEIATDPSFRELKGGLLEGIPELPAYPAATLVGSAERNRPGEKNRGYRIKWTTTDSPAQVMAWYEKTLPTYGWTYELTEEPEADDVEARIATPGFSGYLEAETEDYPHGDLTDIVVVLTRK